MQMNGLLGTIGDNGFNARCKIQNVEAGACYIHHQHDALCYEVGVAGWTYGGKDEPRYVEVLFMVLDLAHDQRLKLIDEIMPE